MNFAAILVAALIPIAIGFIWYNPFFLGSAWMNASGLTEEQVKGASMPVIFGVSLLLSLLLSVMVNQIVVHQLHVFSLVVTEPGFNDPTSAVSQWYADFTEQYGDLYRTFGHGAFHGVLAGIFFVLPVLGTNAIFERKSFKYIAINCGYWIVTLALMGGLLGAWK